MTLDEAIKHSEEVAEGYEEDISKWEYTLSEYRKRECVEQTTIPRCEKALNRCKQCASEHRQLAEWLRDYKRLLEQEPSGDLISRGEVLENAFKIYTHECGLLEVVGVATIKTLPSVNPQTGHWIEHPEIETSTPEYLMFYECSECGDKQCFCKSDIHKKHFCNNCGARMEVEQHG
jgi:hypothetical protein